MARPAVRLRSAAAERGTGSPARVSALGARLSERNWTILDSLTRHAFLTSGQLQRLHFWDHATPSAAARICRHVLQRMRDQRLIESIDRRIGGVRAGSSSYVWRLGAVGDRLVRERRGEGSRARRKEPSTYYLAHRLAVAEIDVGLTEWTRQGAFEVLDRQTEPVNWRRYPGMHGVPAVLKPDFYVVTASGDFEDSWFIEVDLGTESIPTLIRKCAQYAAYRATGREQQEHGVYPWVVWQLPNQARLDRLATALRAARALDGRLFRLTTPQDLQPLIVHTGGTS